MADISMLDVIARSLFRRNRSGYVRLAFRSNLGAIARKHGAIARKHGAIARKHGAIAGKHGAVAGRNHQEARRNRREWLAFLYMSCEKMSKLCQGANAFACFRAIQLRAVPRRAIHGGRGLLLAIASCNLLLKDYGQIVLRTCIEVQDAGKEIHARFAMCIP